MSDPIERRSRKLAAFAALLFLLGGLTGVPLAFAQTAKISADPHALMGAHLAALLGSFWLLGAGWSLRFLKEGRGVAVLFWSVLISAYSNWIITSVKAFLHVKGVDFTGDPANDAIAALLDVFVVAPTFAAGVVWSWLLFKRDS